MKDDFANNINHGPFSNTLARSKVFGLTSREREVLYWRCFGAMDKQVAVILGVSNKTIQKHADVISKVTGFNTKLGQLKWAFQKGIVDHRVWIEQKWPVVEDIVDKYLKDNREKKHAKKV